MCRPAVLTARFCTTSQPGMVGLPGRRRCRLLVTLLLGTGCVERDQPPRAEQIPGSSSCADEEVLGEALSQTVIDAFYPCCAEQGRWIPDSMVPEPYQGLLERHEESGALCVPVRFLSDPSRVPPSCVSLARAEGRCLSVCIPQVAEYADILPVAGCAPEERCAPCYDPFTGEPTGACTVSPCDAPVRQPTVFAACGERPEDAYCVPAELVPSEQQAHFDSQGCGEGCPGFQELCVPGNMLEVGDDVVLVPCTTDRSGIIAAIIAVLGLDWEAVVDADAFREGRCVSRCLPEVRENALFLGQSECSEQELCVPCYDPRQPSERVPTGVCDL